MFFLFSKLITFKPAFDCTALYIMAGNQTHYLVHGKINEGAGILLTPH